MIKIFYENLEGIEYLFHEVKTHFKYHIIRKDEFIRIKSNILFPEQPRLKLFSIFKNFKCKCGKFFTNIKNLDRLPSIGWEELIDHWSCHNHEFKSLLNLQPKPRKNSLLYSSFYFLANSKDLCCYDTSHGEVKRIFYNEVKLTVDADYIIYLFIDEYFKNNDILKVGNLKIKFFNKCIIGIDEKELKFYQSLKVGYKIEENKQNEKEISDYYINTMETMLERNKIDKRINGFTLSFIFCDKTEIKSYRIGENIII